tara:strand:+ start:1649 stop:2197 length:549 start_codon:yes stop_codon:yes gene_type:complete
MTSILKVDNIQKANGSTPTAGDLGINTTSTILQVKQVISNTASSAFNSRTFTDIPGMTIAITPISTSSNILISTSLSWGCNSNPYAGVIIQRNGSNIIVGPVTSSGETRATFGLQGVDNAYRLMCTHYQLLDTAVSTTSEVTYKLQWSTNVILYLNRVHSLQSGNANTTSGVSTITAMEIGG